MAVMVSFLAVTLALVEIGATSAQTSYLTLHIAAANSWALYQTRNLHAMMSDAQAALLESLPGANDAAIQARIKATREEAARSRDDPTGGEGMKQLADRARAQEAARAEAFHVYHAYETTGGVLDIAIVLSSISVITRVRQLGWAAGILGVGALASGLAVVMHLI